MSHIPITTRRRRRGECPTATGDDDADCLHGTAYLGDVERRREDAAIKSTKWRRACVATDSQKRALIGDVERLRGDAVIGYHQCSRKRGQPLKKQESLAIAKMTARCALYIPKLFTLLLFTLTVTIPCVDFDSERI